MRFRELNSPDDVSALVEEVGFLPFFTNEIPGFSVEDCCPPRLWFSATADGPWEWKGPVARAGRCVYGKFFGGRAGYVSREWFADFANYRRDGYDFDSRCEMGMSPLKDREVYDAIAADGAIVSKALKARCNYRKGGNKGFDTLITRLQMQTYVNISDFIYMRDRYGREYGWGVAVYSTPEHILGADAVTAAYRRDPLASRERILSHLSAVLPNVPARALEKLLG